MTSKTNYNKIFYLFFIFIILLGCNPVKNENITAKEMSLKETLAFAGIDANITFTDNTVNIIYDLPIKYEEDLILANYYILGAAYHEFLNSKYRLIYQIEDIAYYTETNSEIVEKYLKNDISLLEFNKNINVYVR